MIIIVICEISASRQSQGALITGQSLVWAVAAYHLLGRSSTLFVSCLKIWSSWESYHLQGRLSSPLVNRLKIWSSWESYHLQSRSPTLLVDRLKIWSDWESYYLLGRLSTLLVDRIKIWSPWESYHLLGRLSSLFVDRFKIWSSWESQQLLGISSAVRLSWNPTMTYATRLICKLCQNLIVWGIISSPWQIVSWLECVLAKKFITSGFHSCSFSC